MFRSPSLRGVLAKLVPKGFREWWWWGAWHVKIYGADDDVMLSGWVLVSFGFPSDIWVIPQGYSNRQTRLRWPERSRPLLLRPSRHGIFLQTPARHSVSNIPPYEDYTLHWLNLNTHHTPHGISTLDFKNAIGSGEGSLPTISWPTELFFFYHSNNIRKEETTFESLFCLHLLLDLTSGYFSLYTPYISHILNATNLDCRTVAWSRKVCSCTPNRTFLNMDSLGRKVYPGGFQKLIPCTSNLNASCLLRKLADFGVGCLLRRQCVLLKEWERPEWNNTCRIKACFYRDWLSSSPSTAPGLTPFGSTNL